MKKVITTLALLLICSISGQALSATRNESQNLHSFANWNPDGNPNVKWTFIEDGPARTSYYAYAAQDYVAQVWLKIGIRGAEENCQHNCLIGASANSYVQIKMIKGQLGCDPNGTNPNYLQNASSVDFAVPSGRAINPGGQGGQGTNILISRDNVLSEVVGNICSAVRLAHGNVASF